MPNYNNLSFEQFQNWPFPIQVWSYLEIPVSMILSNSKSIPGKTWKTAMQGLLRQKSHGYLNGVFGRKIDNPQDVILVTTWESAEALETYETSESYAEHLRLLNQLTIKSIISERVHMRFRGRLTPTTPFTQVIDIYLPSPITSKSFEKQQEIPPLADFLAAFKQDHAYLGYPHRGWVQGAVKWDGEDAEILRCVNFWKSRQYEDQFREENNEESGFDLYKIWDETVEEAGAIAVKSVYYHLRKASIYFSSTDCSDEEQDGEDDYMLGSRT